MLQQLSGQGELWVNQDGLPVRQVLEFDIPEVNQEYSAHIQMSADFSSYGKVDALPKAVQGPDGKWLLQGTLTAEAASSLGKFPGFGQLPVQVAASEPENLATIAGWWSHITSTLPLRVSPTAVILFVLILLVVIFFSFYRRYPRRCYAFIVFVLIPIMVFSPLLESTGVVKFMERQVQAAEAGRSAVPEFLQALGLDPAMVDVDTTSPSDTADEGDNPSEENPEILTPQAALEQAAASKPEGAPYYDVLIPTVNGSSEEALEICGYGTPGDDTDGDLLTDTVEYCLGTLADNADTDGDSIPDGTEVLGFDLGSTHWDSDPLNSDSNRDGIPDTREWSKTLTPNGLAVTDDIDSDGIPNIWDEDDDGDEVPDAFDISPNALTDYTTEFNLTTQGTMTTGTEAIEIEVQPLEKDHLRYSTTVLDWPYDEEGNIRDLNDSKLDLRLTPFLLVTTNVQPTQELLEQYGTKAWYDEEQGKNVLLITLQPLEDGGAVYAFYGKVAYEAVQTGDIQWNAKVVWMAQMQADTNVCHYVYYAGHDECEIETEATILHQYQETFRITGLTGHQERELRGNGDGHSRHDHRRPLPLPVVCGSQ